MKYQTEFYWLIWLFHIRKTKKKQVNFIYKAITYNTEQTEGTLINIINKHYKEIKESTI